MFGFRSGSGAAKKVNYRRGRKSTKSTRRLRFEWLETREVLAGVVNIDTLTVPGALSLIGDGSNNSVEIRQSTIVGAYEIGRPAGDSTLFQLNGSGQTLTGITVNGISGDISINLGDGNDLLNFNGLASGGLSNVPADLSITNAAGSKVNILNKVLVNGDLTVTKDGATSGYSELQIIGSTVIGDTTVNNLGSGSGDTKTVIDTSSLQAGGANERGLLLDNGAGDDTVDVRGNSQFGTGSFVAAQPIVVINNGNGASRTTFTGASQVAGSGTTTVYGALEVNNGDNLPLNVNLVTFNQVNVLGQVDVTNGTISGTVTTSTSVLNSTLGSQLTSSGTGGPMTVNNYAGFDEFVMIGSTLPWGLEIDNDIGSSASNWGSKTDISASFIGTIPLGSQPWALQLSGDNGADLFNLASTAIAFGSLDLHLFDGNNTVAITAASTMPSLFYGGGAGNDSFTMDNSRVQIEVQVRLESGADSLRLLNIDSTEWPSPLLGSILLDGGDGVDSINTSALLLGPIIQFFEQIVA
jgi:hypothetical protein